MAYTFDELFANAPLGGIGEFERWIVDTVITRVQEDGRVSYTQDWLFLEHARNTIEGGIGNPDSAFDVLEFFNDRARFTGPADHLGLVISRLSPTSCRIVRTLKSWNNALEQVDLSLPANAAAIGKIYEGRGITIAGGHGEAIWCMTFAALEKRNFLPG